MKKNIIPLVVAGTLLVGCSSSSAVSYSSKVSDGDKTVITIGNDKLTKNEVYHSLLEQYGSAEVLTLALTYIANQEITDETAIKAKVDETLATISENATVSLDEYVKQLGYKNQQDYIDGILTDNAKQELLNDKYIDDNYKDLIKEYKVRYLKVITVDTESGASKLIDQIKGGADFNTISTENNGTDAGLVTTKSTNIDSNIIKNLGKFTKDGLYNKVIKTSNSKYAVVYVYNTDKKALKDEIKDKLSSINEISTKMESHYLKEYNFDVHEKAIKDEIKKANEDYLG